MKHRIRLRVNGQDHEVLVDTRITLVDLLRERMGLTGTNKGCATGECGACTVIMNGDAVNSCLVLAVDGDGAQITTVEGLAHNGNLDPLQQAFIDEGAVQCGFCTPGMIMVAKDFLRKNPSPSEDDYLTAISGNLCRCTGYIKILNALKKAAESER
jgi:carbon-monoxide dehydrogenase small subunit